MCNAQCVIEMCSVIALEEGQQITLDFVRIFFPSQS